MIIDPCTPKIFIRLGKLAIPTLWYAFIFYGFQTADAHNHEGFVMNLVGTLVVGSFFGLLIVLIGVGVFVAFYWALTGINPLAGKL